MKNLSKTMLIAALPLMGLAACSGDDINGEPDMPQPSQSTRSAISFAPTFDRGRSRQTRAGSVYDSNNLPTEFNVGAIYNPLTATTANPNKNPSLYFSNDTYSKASGEWLNLGGTRYWPDDAKLDFYAFVMDDKTAADSINWNKDALDILATHPKAGTGQQLEGNPLYAPYIAQYQVNSTARQQYDLMYAVKLGATKTLNAIPLNFRHALSQVVFDAMNVNPRLYIEIDGVAVKNIQMRGEFVMPGESTDIANNGQTTSYGSWKFDGKSISGDNMVKAGNSTTTFNTVGLVGNTDTSVAPTPLTSADQDLTMLLLPQTVKADMLDNAQTAQNMTVPGHAGIYVNCTIWQVRGAQHDPTFDKVLWGNADGTPKELKIPVDINWQAGKRYIYTLSFGKGTAGYDPADNEPVLVPINLDITADDWQDVPSQKMDY